MARNRYPQTRQLLLANQKGTEAIKNINSNWLPKSSVVGSATYQSEVSTISLPASIPVSIESPAKDQYKAGIELSQLIFDGGLNSTQKSIEKLNLTSETNRIEGELLKVKSQVNDLFLGLLINKESYNALSYIKKDLTERHVSIESAVQSGTMLITTMKELEAEIIGIDQKIIENKSQRLTFLSTLSILVQEKLDTSTVFIVPGTEPFLFEKDITIRPEYKQLSTQIELFDWRNKLINKGNLPKIAVFGNGYYGRPGLDFFNNDFRFYGMAGVSFSWNIGGNYTSVHQKKQLVIDRQVVENQRTLFELGMQTQLSQQEHEITKLQELIIQDKSVTDLRSEVRQTAAVQYENGSITTTDYILKLNAETQAIISSSIHKIQLTMAYINYKTLLGK
jgi:outer membrane protein TolC